MENRDNEQILDGEDGSDASKFNDTLIRMLKTPPKPHDHRQGSKDDNKLSGKQSDN